MGKGSRNEANQTRVEEVAVPSGSLIADMRDVARFVDHTDAFRVRVAAAQVPDVDAFAHAFLGQEPPRWVAAAMRARDAVVGTFFGLKTAGEGLEAAAARASTGAADELPPFAPGTRTGLFQTVARSASEIVFGEDDRHLDFRVSLLHERDGDEAVVTVSTVVRFNNALGRAYFLPVRPMHALVVPAMMRRALVSVAAHQTERRDALQANASRRRLSASRT